METPELHRQVSHLIFSGEYDTGSNLVERQLADRLGVSRIPVRETLTRLVAQGTLVGGRKGEGVRMRKYSADEIRQLYDYRAVIEGGVARSAAGMASEADVLRLTVICDEMEAVFSEEDTMRWGTLDEKFHEALAEAGRNDRFEQALKTLLRECFYLFYVLSRRNSRRELSPESLASHKRQAIDDHRALVRLIEAGDADASESLARLHILRSADRLVRATIETDLGLSLTADGSARQGL